MWYNDQNFGAADFQELSLEALLLGRYYLNPGRRLQIFLQAGSGMQKLESYHNGYFIAQAGPGINYFLTDRLLLEMAANWTWRPDKQATGVSAQVGTKFVLGGHRPAN